MDARFESPPTPIFPDEGYPCRYVRFLSKEPDVKDGRYWYRVELKDGQAVSPQTLSVDSRLHAEIQEKYESKKLGEHFRFLYPGEDDCSTISDTFINWRSLRKMTEEEAGELYSGLLETFTGRKAK